MLLEITNSLPLSLTVKRTYRDFLTSRGRTATSLTIPSRRTEFIMNAHPAKWETFNINRHTEVNDDPIDRNRISVYTDGSKKENLVGAAFIAYHEGKIIHSYKCRLPDVANSFDAETHAFKLALDYYQETNSKLELET